MSTFLHSPDIFQKDYTHFKRLSKNGSVYYYCEPEFAEGILKTGDRVAPPEEMAMRMVKEHCPLLPVPDVITSEYGFDTKGRARGGMCMTLCPGKRLDELWGYLDDATKQSICETIWSYVVQLRHIPKPAQFPFLCLTDGSNSEDVLVRDLPPNKRLWTDEDVRNHITQRYYAEGGSRRHNVAQMLPRADTSVFTHGDIAPRNIIFDGQQITGLVDWEYAGWYPEYWECVNIFRKPSRDDDWQRWMQQTYPTDFLPVYDISGIALARKVLRF